MCPGPDRNPEPLAADVARAAEELSGVRGVVVAGSNWWMAPSEVAALASQLGWPLLAEPMSGLRQPAWALAAGQALLGSERFLERHRPEVVLQIGATPTTRATQRFVAAAERLVVVDAFHVDPDPEHRATWRLLADPDRLATQLIRSVRPAPDDWKAAWTDLDERARRAMDGVLDATDDPTELRLARDLAAIVPEGGTLFVGNSLPIRDLDFAMSPRDGLQVLANRGASGIDGLVSTALGVASAGIGPTFALIGDLSLLYDVGALLWNGARLPADLVLVVANNRGGAIFGALDQRTLPERDRLFVTPHDVDVEAVCAAAGVGHDRVEQMSRFRRNPARRARRGRHPGDRGRGARRAEQTTARRDPDGRGRRGRRALTCRYAGRWGRGGRMELQIKRFDAPDETRAFERGTFDVVQIGGVTIGRARYERAGNGRSMSARSPERRCARWSIWVSSSRGARCARCPTDGRS